MGGKKESKEVFTSTQKNGGGLNSELEPSRWIEFWKTNRGGNKISSLMGEAGDWLPNCVGI